MNLAEMQEVDVVVVGGGPAGLMAALSAAKRGVRVVLFEQLDRPGIRLLATGGGRCNLTNTAEAAAFRARFGAKARFVSPALSAFGPAAVRHFMADLGVQTHAPDGIHVFPCSDSAADVRNALLSACSKRHISLRPNTPVSALRTQEGRNFGVETPGGTLAARAVVLAAGGKSYPRLGGGEGGYQLARQSGHTIIPPVPALVPLLCEENWPGTCTGLSLPDVLIRLPDSEGRSIEARGALLFTHRGLSGPAVLNLSGEIATRLATAERVPIEIRLQADRTPRNWEEEWACARQEAGRRSALTVLAGQLPRSLASLLLQQTAIQPGTPIARLTRTETARLNHWLDRCPLTIRGTEGFERAMVTRGGVSVDDVNARTLESRLVTGLYFAGEVLDVDGPCGGYNLQWAFSSGRLAGLQAAKVLTR